MPAADIVTLDRVVCCYPDMDRLVALSAEKARRLYGVVYPRDSLWMKVAMAGVNAVCRIRRCAFRVRIHSARAIDEAVRREGLEQRARRRGLAWDVMLYERPGATA